MDRPGHVKDADEDAFKRDWKEDLKIAEESTEYRHNFMNMLEEFETMWDGDIERINVAKHRIKLESYIQCSVHSTLYRAGPKARALERQEVERIITEKKIK